MTPSAPPDKVVSETPSDEGAVRRQPAKSLYNPLVARDQRSIEASTDEHKDNAGEPVEPNISSVD